MKTGQLVKFSGTFLPSSDNDCLNESSLTLDGKLESPEFIFRFLHLSSYDPSEQGTTNLSSPEQATTSPSLRTQNQQPDTASQEVPTADPITQPQDVADKPYYEDHDGSPTSDAITLIRNAYMPRDANTYSNTPQWFAEKKNTLSNDDEVIAVKLAQSKADPICEWTVEIKPGDHDHYKLIRMNDAASETFIAGTGKN
jgi:hypothetical protein